MLILRPVRLTSAGTYHCQPFNSLGKGGVGTARLSVVQEPRIIAGLPNQVSKLGKIKMFDIADCAGGEECRPHQLEPHLFGNGPTNSDGHLVQRRTGAGRRAG